MIIYYFNGYDVNSWDLVEAKIADLSWQCTPQLIKKKKEKQKESWK